jgi:hypothetical protein
MVQKARLVLQILNNKIVWIYDPHRFLLPSYSPVEVVRRLGGTYDLLFQSR